MVTAVGAPRLRRVERAAPKTGSRLGRAWFALLLMSICFEGLGRKFLPQAPTLVFYFLKDAVLLLGLSSFGIPRSLKHTVSQLTGPGKVFISFGIGWTVLECLNPSQGNIGLAILGMRSYWLWWIAPLVIASALRDEQALARASVQLAWITIVVAAFAALQFARPADDAFNAYATYEGAKVSAVSTVVSTGRARVSSTFGYISGFSAFAQLAPTLLLSFGLTLPKGRNRKLILVATAACMVTLPMSGSRGPLLFVFAGLAAVVWGAGALRTRTGRRLAMAGAFGLVSTLVLSQDAVKGVLDRMQDNTSETGGRLLEFSQVLPPVAMAAFDFPLAGTGTGTEQNAAYALRLHQPPYGAEAETGKILVELGPVGSILLFLVRALLVSALYRGAKILRERGQGGIAGAALALMFTAMFGKLFFDHVAQALLLTSVGLLLARVHLSLPGAPVPKPGRRGPQAIGGRRDGVVRVQQHV